jgi:hypothetical protein
MDASFGCLDMATTGLLSLLLRSLACQDNELRGLAYECLALYETTLENSIFRYNTLVSWNGSKTSMGAFLCCLDLTVSQQSTMLIWMASLT